MRELIKITNGGRNGVYLYSAIIKIDNKYFWTKSIFCKSISDKHKINWINEPVTKELNNYSLNYYNLKPITP